VKQKMTTRVDPPVKEEDSVSGVYTTTGEADPRVYDLDEIKMYQELLKEDEDSFMKDFDLNLNNDDDDVSTISGTRTLEGAKLYIADFQGTDYSCTSADGMPPLSEESSDTVKAATGNHAEPDDNRSSLKAANGDITQGVTSLDGGALQITFKDIFPEVAGSLMPISRFEAHVVQSRIPFDFTKDLEHGDSPTNSSPIHSSEEEDEEHKKGLSFRCIIIALALTMLVAVSIAIGAMVAISNSDNEHRVKSTMSSRDEPPTAPSFFSTEAPTPSPSITAPSTKPSTSISNVKGNTTYLSELNMSLTPKGTYSTQYITF
jgi:hypothetical protein